MKVFSILCSLALASVATAAPSDWASPTGGYGGSNSGGNCVTQTQATQIVHDFAFFLAHADPNQIQKANATAQRIIASKFTQQSDSINGFGGIPPGAPTATNKQDYITGTLAQPPITGITDLQLVPYNCNQILWYWRFANPGNLNAPLPPQPVQGFNSFTIDSQGLITDIKVEFSVFFYVDLGFNVSGFAGPITGVNP